MKIDQVNLHNFKHQFYFWPALNTVKFTLIAIHGFGSNGRMFRHAAPFLQSAGCEIYALDLLGFGQSEKPRQRYSLYQYAKIIAEFVQTLKLENPILIGHSLGGQISIPTVIDNPDMFRGLCLVNNGGFHPIERFRKLGSFAPLIVLLNQPWFVKYFLRFIPVANVLRTEQSRKDLFRFRNSHSFLDFRYKGYHKRLNEIRLPLWILWGERDKVLPKSTPKYIQKALNQPPVHYIENAGHNSPVHQPERFAELVITFCNSLLT